ncbi:MAG: hypothetical protein V4555_04160 [Acidobacteriota bacterium]
MNPVVRVLAFFSFLVLLSSPAFAQAKAAPATTPAAQSAPGCDKPVFQPRDLDPLVRYTAPQLFERYTDGKLMPCQQDRKVAADATGYAGSWRGKPWYEPLLWCSTMLNIQADKQSLPKDSPESVAAQHLYQSAYSDYQADRGKPWTETITGNVGASLYASIRLSYKHETGLEPDGSLCMSVEKAYIAALAAAKPGKKTPPQAFDQFNKDRFPPDSRDLLVPQRATGFGTQWVGQPWFKVMLWCAAEVDTAGKDDQAPQLARTFMYDALRRYQADRGVSDENAKAIQGARSRLDIMFAVPGALEDQVGHSPNVQTCNGMHQGYVALTSTTTPAVADTSLRQPASSPSGIPYPGTGGPLTADAKDLRVVAPSNSSLARWSGHAWHEPLLWCTALNMVRYQSSPSDEIKQIVITDLLLSGNRVAKDRGVPLDQIGGTVREQAAFIGKQMLDDGLVNKPQFVDFERGCTDIVSVYQREAAK